MAAAIKVNGGAVERLTPVALFETNVARTNSSPGTVSQRYGVLDNGQRFVVAQSVAASGVPAPSSIEVVVNWSAGRK